ncbi:hypothetical protein [Streptomyces sp. NPDC050704]|uniref:hypothetical protein n=1 Tax=Streptomyces sp. NPDC050704 TaxID=3157219 RepID=UPI0034476194
MSLIIAVLGVVNTLAMSVFERQRHHVCWVDRDRLRRWAEHGTPQDLLHLPNRPARRAALRRAA